ncbi:hypothetical protein [Absidia glauca]|uniref:Uncharacterized protein n=1 Tax=Absidia glauca TaxID=4829 RepID=A0A163JR20_ABSGL|nr:hypothetical protein [Absidia glauca]
MQHLQTSGQACHWYLEEPNSCDSSNLIQHIKIISDQLEWYQKWQVVQELSILNERYCTPNQLSGAFLVVGGVSIITNTIEPYSWDSLLDGQKLVISTRTCNFLATHSDHADLDWQSIQTDNIFVDLGFQYHLKDHVGLWRLLRPSSSMPKVFHRRLLKMLLGKKIRKANYTKYDLSGIKNVGGFKYTSSNIGDGAGRFGIHKIIAYQPIKEHFVRKDGTRKSARWNTSQVCSPEDVWKKSKNFMNIMNTFISTANNIGSTSYGARLEVRMRLRNASNLESYNKLMTIARDLHDDPMFVFVPTKLLIKFWVSR